MGSIDNAKVGVEDLVNNETAQSLDDADSFKSNFAEVVEAQTLMSTNPENYTICAPQLLHLDLSWKPLWFNGWILDNKFADKSRRQFGNFETYIVEPHGWDGEDMWQLQQDNQCCLTTYPRLKFSFSEVEKETLSMIIQRAREVEALVLS